MAITALAAGVVLWIACAEPGIDTYYRANFIDVLEGDAHNPFVQRRLVPALIRGISSLVPARLADAVEDGVGQVRLLRRGFEEFHWQRENATEYLVAAAVLYGCLIGFVISLLHLLDALVACPAWFRHVAAIVALLGLPPLFKFHVYLYDFAVLFLFTLGLALIVREKWLAYSAVYVLACANKETGILLALVFAVWQAGARRERRSWFYGFLALQVVVAVTIKLLTWAVYRDNPGPTVEFNLFLNLQLLRPYPLATLLAWLAVPLLVATGWSSKPLFLRRALWIAVPLAATIPFFGILDELRASFELYPIVLLLALLTFLNVEDGTLALPGRGSSMVLEREP